MFLIRDTWSKMHLNVFILNAQKLNIIFNKIHFMYFAQILLFFLWMPHQVLASDLSAETDFIKQKQGEINRIKLSHIGGNIFFYKNMDDLYQRYSLILADERDVMLEFERNVRDFPFYVDSMAPSSEKMHLLFVDIIGENAGCDFKNLIENISVSKIHSSCGEFELVKIINSSLQKDIVYKIRNFGFILNDYFLIRSWLFSNFCHVVSYSGRFMLPDSEIVLPGSCQNTEKVK